MPAITAALVEATLGQRLHIRRKSIAICNFCDYIGTAFMHALVFTKSGATVRVISLRREHKTEVKRYAEKA
jgi:uncharacterized DUF497 family protein